MTDAEYQILSHRLTMLGLSMYELIDVNLSARVMMGLIGQQDPAARVAANRTLAYLEREAEKVRNGGDNESRR